MLFGPHVAMGLIKQCNDRMTDGWPVQTAMRTPTSQGRSGRSGVAELVKHYRVS